MAESVVTTKLTHLSLATTESTGLTDVPKLHVPSGSSLLVDGVAAFTGVESHTGAATFTGGIGLNSALTLGLLGVPFKALRKSTLSVALGTIGLDSITTSVTDNNAAAGDICLRIVPGSLWSGSYFDIGLEAIASANSTWTLAARNSAATGINTTAMNMDFYWLDLA